MASVAALYLEQRIVDEDVLVLGLDHVVPLGPQAGHVPVHVHLDSTVQYTGTLVHKYRPFSRVSSARAWSR